MTSITHLDLISARSDVDIVDAQKKLLWNLFLLLKIRKHYLRSQISML